MSYNNKKWPKVELVATRVPEGKMVHTKLGVNCPIPFPNASYVDPELALASKVGLEWRLNGEKIKESDDWANTSFVLISTKKDTSAILDTHK